MIPGNLDDDGDLTQEQAKLVLAHELAHALQDQHLDLKRLDAAVQNVEQTHALRATIEGHATMIEDFVAARWGLVRVRSETDEGARGASGAIALGAAGPGDDQRLIDEMHEYQDLLAELYYHKGGEFFQHNFDRGGHKQVWRILADPPRDTAAFIDPARYWQPGKGVSDPDALFAELSGYFGGGPWTAKRFALGAFTLRIMYRKMGSQGADQLVSAVQSARALELVRESEGGNGGSGFASAVVFVLRGTPDPVSFVQSLDQAPPGLLDELRSDDAIVVAPKNMRRMPGIQAKIAREIKFEMRNAGPSSVESPSAQGRVARFAHSKWVIEITEVGAIMTDQQCIELVEELLRRCEQEVAPVRP
jgi:hypothetical protein